MDPSEDCVQTLLNMGFFPESEVRRALRMAKNDINDAVAILTNDHPVTGFDTLGDLDVEMKDELGHGSSSRGVGSNVSTGYFDPPSYDDALKGIESSQQDSQKTDDSSKSGPQEEETGLTFPSENLYELENRVFTSSWSIPYKKEESLGKCLLAATRLAGEGLCESDEHCEKFLTRCMPECFQKLLTSGAVRRWAPDIQEGIFDMLQLLVDLVATRVQYEPVPVGMLHVLATAFNPDTEYHTKNCSRRPDKTYYEEKFGANQMYAITSSKDPFGWLTNLINRFAEKDGFESIRVRLESNDLDAPSMAALLAPFGHCADYLNSSVVLPLLAPGMEAAVKFVQKLNDNELKDKRVSSVCDMLATMKLLCLALWPKDVKNIDSLRLDVILRMLKSPHFNARMNALKELTKLLEENAGNKAPKSALDQEAVLDWMVGARVLSIALEGNIDQQQYCEKVKSLVEYLGPRLSVDELTKIWKMQHEESTVVIDNIHTIIGAAGVKFNLQQLEHLFKLIQRSWEVENDKIREKLLGLIGKIGSNARLSKTTTRVLELLWDLAHLPALKTSLVEQALAEHLAILNDSFIVKEPIKREYLNKCVYDIREGVWVLPALNQLLQIAKNIAKHSFHKAEKGILQELNKSYDIIKQVAHSLLKFHLVAVQCARDNGTSLSEHTLVDGRYSHQDFVTVHLSFLQFILQEGGLYLSWNRARELWDTLVASPDACDWDKQTCFEWFNKGLLDLEQDTQAQFYQKELLRTDPSKLSPKGFTCFKSFFESVNQFEHKLKKSGSSFIVEKTDLSGLDFLWEICLNTPDNDISEMSISLLLNLLYCNLASRFKRDPVALHKKFIDECYRRLELAMIPLGGSAVAQGLSLATTILTAVGVPEAATAPSPSRTANLLNIERLLLIAEQYIVNVEELHTAPRTIPPHGASFQGQPITVYVVCESQKAEFNIKAHGNEMVRSVRQKIGRELKCPAEQVQIMVNNRMLTKDQKLLHQLGVEDNTLLSVRTFTSSVTSSSSSSYFSSTSDTPSTPTKQSFDLEQEKMLPGVLMSMGGQVFDMLYQLADLDEPKITTHARKLLNLMPTDPSILDALDCMGHKKATRQPSPEEANPKVSPRASPRKFIAGASPTPASTPPPAVRNNPQQTLKQLFDAQAPSMSCFRVLYNLEILSSKLMPTMRDAGSVLGAKSFCADFLLVNGLSYVVNVLQKDAMPADVDYEIRQGSYGIALQLLRYLLCGEEATNDCLTPTTPRRASTCSLGVVAVAAGGVASGGGASAGGGASVGGGPISQSVPTLSKTASSPPKIDSTASKVIQTMSVSDFTETVACFMRVTWAAAAGKLHLASTTQPLKDSLNNVSGYTSGSSRSRPSTGSTGSTGSSNSDSDIHSLHTGVCIRQTTITPKDATIAKEALELLVTCLQLRNQLLATFYSLPCVSDFIIDVLVGCTQTEIREVALSQFYLLAQSGLSPSESSGHQQSPHRFIMHTLLKARLPFWVSTSSTRGASYRLLQHCSQYFELRCRLLSKLSASEQETLQINVMRMLEDEIDWLAAFVSSESHEVRVTDNKLIAGHLRLISTLLTCEGVDKRTIGKALIQDMLHDFIFPASKIMMDAVSRDASSTMGNFNAKCSSSDSRVAAYELLIELASGCPDNLSDLCMELINMHHLPNPETAKEWEFMPPVDSRSSAGYVGLRNAGATCYMNSVLQQLYMAPNVPEALLGIDDDTMDPESVLFQVQQVFGHLQESKLQYYVPEKFWNVFKLWGQQVNVREQQDALDFYQACIDQCEDQIKKLGLESIFKKKFQGVYSDQKICKDCPHRYEREEVFFALNVTVKNNTLQDELAQFVKGDMLEGDNAYFCEKCGEKRNSVKRMCIKTLPPVLCIQLKRFDYDWEANRALKFDDYFKFPFVLDMEPYTAEGMARQDALDENQVVPDVTSTDTDENEAAPPGKGVLSDSGVSLEEGTCELGPGGVYIGPSVSKQINYELVGVVVHSGQANAGHYYSFIKERRGNYMTNPNRGKWFKFNDTVVEEFDMNDDTLEEECFGGKYKAKVYDQGTVSSYPEERLRYWNGYLLFYERMEEMRSPVSAKKSKVALKRPELASVRRTSRQDSLRELTELVHKGEKKGIFHNHMPASIQQVVREENLRFMKDRDVYNLDYFKFVRQLTNRNITQQGGPEMYAASLKLATHFLFNTYLRTKKKLRVDLEEWEELLGNLLTNSKEACMWMVEYLATEGKDYIKPFLLECPTKEIRVTFGKTLEKMISSFFQHGGMPMHKCFDEIIQTMLELLGKDVPENCKQCVEYFRVIKAYSQMGTKAASHMFFRQSFKRLVTFLVGTSTSSSDQQDSGLRRWSSLQARDFGPLHATLAILILNCDVAPHYTEGVGNYAVRAPTTVTVQKVLKMNADMVKYVYGPESSRFIRETVLSLREVTGGSISHVEDMLAYCSFCNWSFSLSVLTNIMTQYSSAPSNELTGLFQVLLEILLLEDSLQLKRFKCVIEGFTDDSGSDYDGMLAVIKSNHMNDSRRSYQCIKFLVSLTTKCALAKDYLMQAATRWQWAVNWLKKKMTEYNWSSPTNVTSNEDSNTSSRSFQRTISAQDTLNEATALLTEIEAHESSSSDMDSQTDATQSLEDTGDTVKYSLPSTHMDASTSLQSSDTIPTTIQDLDTVDEKL